MFRTYAGLLLAVAALGCRARVQQGLDERDANEIVSALASRGFDAAKVAEKAKKPTWAVEVPEKHVTQAVQLLAEFKLPRPARALTRDLVGQPGLVETPASERARQLEGVEGDLEQALESLDGVASASVELALPAGPVRSGQAAPPTRAAVLLRVRSETHTRMLEQRGALRGLVAGAVEGLAADDVTLFVDPVQAHTSAPAMPPPTPRALVWALLAAMLTFAAGFVLLLLRQAGLLTPQPATPAAAPAPSARARPTPPSPRLIEAPPMAKTLLRSPQRAA